MPVGVERVVAATSGHVRLDDVIAGGGGHVGFERRHVGGVGQEAGGRGRQRCADERVLSQALFVPLHRRYMVQSHRHCHSQSGPFIHPAET